MTNSTVAERRAFEFSAFIAAQQEFNQAISTNDLNTAGLALGEIECIWMHTEWPRLRVASASFLHRHAEYAELTQFAI